MNWAHIWKRLFRVQPYWSHGVFFMELAKNFVEGAKGIGNEVLLSKRFLISRHCGFIIAVFQISAPFKWMWLHRCKTCRWVGGTRFVLAGPLSKSMCSNRSTALTPTFYCEQANPIPFLSDCMREWVSQKEQMGIKRLSVDIGEKVGLDTIASRIIPVPWQKFRMKLYGFPVQHQLNACWWCFQKCLQGQEMSFMSPPTWI